MENSEKAATKPRGRPFVKGQSGNPLGRPPQGYSITEAFKAMLGAEPETKRQIVDSIKRKALSGDTAAQKMIWQYMDGMPAQKLEHTGEDGGPITTHVTVEFVRGPGKDS